MASYDDPAISGASMILRPGVQALVQDAQRGKFDVVLAEALDRMSRDQAAASTLLALISVTTGTFAGCARATSGHAVETVMPLMKSRRRIGFVKA